MTDYTSKFSDRIKKSVFRKQVKLIRKLEDKYVERDGSTFLVVKVDLVNDRIIVSDTKTPTNIKTSFRIQSFLSKAVRVVDD